MTSTRIFLLAGILTVPFSALSQSAPVDLVNPLIGTAGDGQTYPAAGMPFGMTQWTPQTRDGETKCIAPYYAADTRIQGFRGSHFLTGSCTQDYGSVTIMPLLSAEKLDPAGRSSSFSHEKEQSHPYEYSVDLLESGIHVDLTGTERSGLMRFRYPASVKAAVLAIQENHRLGTGSIRVDEKNQEVTGWNPAYRIYAGNGKPAGFSGYFVVQFSQPFKTGGTWSGDERHIGSVSQDGAKSAAGAFVSFDLTQGSEVLVRIGTSFTSVEEARRNLAEIPDWNFAGTVQKTRAAWEQALHPFDLSAKSASDSKRTVFYTALYHSFQLPRIFSDRSGSYPQFAGGTTVKTAKGFTYYDDFSIWDTFRAIQPLFTLVAPNRSLDMVKSLITKGEQGGYLPIFPAWNSYTSEMVGDHADAVIADAYAKGIRSFDVQSAYRLMRKNATERPKDHAAYLDGRGRRGLNSYLKYGYIPLEDHISDAFHTDEQVSRTLEYAYDDFLVSEMAKWTGHKEDVKLFADRAQNYRKVIDSEAGYARGRHADGSWETPFDPNGTYKWITEGLPSQYTFFAPQDLPGLVEYLGGKQKFISKLDALFDGGFYNHGNEPGHHIAYLYNFAGAPEKTQLRVRQILQKEYRNSTDGLAGNDDAGQMSAWYVFSSLGFYPVTPGTPRYELASPLFDELSLHLPNGHTLRITAPGASSGRYQVKSVSLNGKPLGRTYVFHDELLAGGELHFELQPTILPAH
ncbi:GH92 family glycosyl hydrolase [Terriglobus tenax]|uniref:GH92 family glycosyl hydrolase n=1 Tax=Terriglobus tenax TaxID=1111115 RepID=UPI0021DFECC2|nr:GH92 family glycosyl hydrolase [Terriglobus tenax]